MSCMRATSGLHRGKGATEPFFAQSTGNSLRGAGGAPDSDAVSSFIGCCSLTPARPGARVMMECCKFSARAAGWQQQWPEQ
mmetsp:Transcript_28193/g.55348  ORF Transcript_28193/g.55348 Transcript_28193/m.55348 type:complete len:81 (+) Transcript_28193:444-686(+)